MRATAFQARHVLLALDSGEPAAVVRALALEVMFVATRGSREHARSARALARLEQAAARLDDERARVYGDLAGAFAAFFEGAFARATALIDRIDARLAAAPDMARELAVGRLFRLWSLVFQGRLAALAREAPRLARLADLRGDVHSAIEADVAGRSLVAIAAGRADEVPELVARALRRWPPDGDFHAPHFDALVAECQADLYRGRAAAVVARLEAAWPRLERELMLTVQVLHVEARFLQGRAAALAHRPATLAAARKALDDEVARGATWARPPALTLAAAQALARSDRAAARQHLLQAALEAEQLHLELLAAAARVALGRVAGDDLAQHEAARGHAWMAEQSAADALALARMATGIAA